jgi:LytS/YehU family sensor histidine kinase
LEQLRFQDRITCTLNISESIESENDILKVPPLLIQRIIESSFKHGLFHELGGGQLNVSYGLEGDTIVAAVDDNVIGRDSSTAMRGAISNKERHSVLKNIMQHLEIFRFNMPEHENSMLVEDIFCDGKHVVQEQ